MQKKSKAKTIVIVILCILLVVESGMLIFGNKGNGEAAVTAEDPVQVVDGGKGEIDTSEVTTQDDLATQADPDSILKGLLTDENGKTKNIGDMLRDMLYTNALPTAAMTMVMPMLYDQAGDLASVAPNINLYVTGPLLAQQMGEVAYTAVDKDGVRKPLTDILTKLGTKWKYLDTIVKWTDENGEPQEGTISSSIDWCVHDQDSFYQAMNDASLGFRGLLEISVQSKKGSIELSKALSMALDEAMAEKLSPVVGMLTGIPGLDTLKYAAHVYNPNEMSGYQAFFVYLFNILGLVDGEYPSDSEVRNYGTMGELFKALIESIVFAVEKIMKDPGQNLANVLLNLVDAIDSGKFIKRIYMCDMHIEYNKTLQKLGVVGADDTLFNLGDTVNGIVKDMGIDLHNNWNGLLKGVFKMLGAGNNVPKFNTAKFLATGKTRTLPNGNKVYTANANATFGYFVDYIMQGEIVELLLGKVGLFKKKDVNKIVKAFNAADDGISNLMKAVIAGALNNLV